jgi:mycothiol synthase
VTAVERESPADAPAGLPAGMRARRPAMVDLPALVALCRADEADAIGTGGTTSAEVQEMLDPAHTSRDRDQWVVLDAAGRLVGWGLVWDHNRTDHQDVDIYRHPSLGSEQVRAVLLDRLLRRLAERAVEFGYDRIVTGAGCYHADTRYAGTLRSRDFGHVRTFHRMRIDLDSSRPVPVDVPDGVRLGPFDGSEAGWRAMHALVEESFVEHWGHTPVGYEAFRASGEAEPHPDQPLWQVAYVADRMVGVSRASGRNAEIGGGYVAELAVHPSLRGRGVARALLQASFEANRQAGRRWVGLNVDSENTTGAVRVYESVGMWPEQRIDAYERLVERAGP